MKYVLSKPHLIEGEIIKEGVEIRVVEQDNLNSNFKSWFGNSKVTDSGKPMVVYHGSNKVFDTFKLANTNEASGDYIGEGYYFAREPKTSLQYGSLLTKYYLRIENPIVISSKKDVEDFYEFIFNIFTLEEVSAITGVELEKLEKYVELVGKMYIYITLKKSQPRAIRDKLESKGYDGLIDNLYGQYAVFDSNQIKSVDNNGEWSSRSDNIYESK